MLYLDRSYGVKRGASLVRTRRFRRSSGSDRSRRIDLLTDISGVVFDAAWPERVIHSIGTLPVPFVGRAALIANKRAAGRPKDLADLDALGAPDKPE